MSDGSDFEDDDEDEDADEPDGATRTTKAVSRRLPALRMPRNSSLPLRKVSASSMSSVGRSSSMTRKKAGGLMFDATTGRWTNWLMRVSRVVLPQRFSGDSTPMWAVR